MIPVSPWLTIAGALCMGLAVIHSVLGERLIFRRWRASPSLPRSHAGIIRASWHGLSLLGAALGIVLWRVPLDAASAVAIAALLLATAALIALWTRLRHPGWIVMALIALLVLISRL